MKTSHAVTVLGRELSLGIARCVPYGQDLPVVPISDADNDTGRALGQAMLVACTKH